MPSRLNAVVIALTISWYTPFAHAEAPTPFDPGAERALGLAAEAVGFGRNARSIGAVAELRTVLPYLGRTDTGITLHLLEAKRLHPLARAMVVHERAAFDLRAGDRTGSNAHLQANGWLLDWEVIGPFTGGPGSLDTPLPPEEGKAANGPFPGRHGSVGWIDMSGGSHLGAIDVETRVRPIDNAIVFARTAVLRAKPGRGVLRVAARGPYKLLVNGRLIGSRTEAAGTNPAERADTDAWPVALPRGESIVLLKLSGEEGQVEFAVRLTNERKAITPIEALGAAAESPRDFARAALLAHEHLPKDSGDPALVFARRARGAGSPDGNTQALLAATASQAYEKLGLLEAAAAQASDPWITLALARTRFESAGDAHVVEAHRTAQALVEQMPVFAAARIFLVGILAEETLDRSAASHARQLVGLHPTNPLALRTAGSAFAGDPRMASTICTLQRFADASNLSVYTNCAMRALERSEPEVALGIVEKGMQLRPDVTGLLGVRAQVRLAANDISGAREDRVALVRLVPGESTYWIDLGLHDVEYGDRVDALEAFAAALHLEPQNADLEAYVEHLDPASIDRPEDAWIIAATPISPEEEEANYSGEDYYFLVDQKVTRVFATGLTTTFVQQMAKVRTNVGAASLRTFSIGYSPTSQQVKIRRARVVKPDGSVRETWQTYEQSLSEPWYNLYYDYVAAIVVLPELSAGDIVELQYTIQQTGTTNILGDYFGEIVFVQDTAPKKLAKYTLIAATDRKLAIRNPGLPHEFTEQPTDDGHTARSWTLRDVPGVESEEGRPGVSEISDYVHVSTFQSWDEVARWYWDLVDEQLVTDDTITRVVAEEIQALTSRRDKVSALHNWVVQNTRYVGLEFGIHGFKPYRTTECLRRRFGDCKDKASLIKVMMEAAGIETNIVLVRTRPNGRIDPSPASLQIFDHAIAYVPEFDLFLDGTAEYSGTSELPWADQGVQVLIVKDGGAFELRQTPVLPANSNTVRTKYTADLRSSTAEVQVASTLTGSFAASYRQRFQTETDRREKIKVQVSQNFPGADLTQVRFSDMADLEIPIEVAYDFRSPGLGERDGDVLRVLPVLRPTRLVARLAPWPSRKQPLEIGHPFVSQETVQLTVPPGARLSTPPSPLRIPSDFGQLDLEVQPNPSGFHVTATLRVDVFRVEPDQYGQFRKWLRSVDEALTRPLTFEIDAK